jgi:hypothetical protein
MSETGTARQVLEAADRLVTAFGEGRVDDYFACFHPEATFIFYTTGRLLESMGRSRKSSLSNRREKSTKRIVSPSVTICKETGS